MPKPFVSIITTTYNAGKTLRETMDSVLSQSYLDYEYILMDNESKDGTIEIIKSYNSDKVRYISERDDGIYDAMNKAILLSRGSWVYFLGSDDVFYDRDVLAKIFSNSNCDSDVIYGDVVLKNSGKRYGGEFIKKRIMRENICHQAIFLKKAIFEKIGMFNLRYTMLADWEFNMRLFCDRFVKKEYRNEIIAIYNEHGASSSRGDFYFNKDYYRLLLIHFSSPTEILKILISKAIKKVIL